MSLLHVLVLALVLCVCSMRSSSSGTGLASGRLVGRDRLAGWGESSWGTGPAPGIPADRGRLVDRGGLADRGESAGGLTAGPPRGQVAATPDRGFPY